jgi:hypothetical protein
MACEPFAVFGTTVFEGQAGSGISWLSEITLHDLVLAHRCRRGPSTPTSYSSDIDNFLAAARREKRLVLQKWTFRSGQIAQLPKPKAGCGPIVYACQQPIQTVYYLGGTNLHWRSAPAGTLLRNSG